jgi:hypothetical protein
VGKTSSGISTRKNSRSDRKTPTTSALDPPRPTCRGMVEV